MFIQSSYFPEGWNSLKMALAIETVAVYHIVSISRMLSLFDILSMFNVLFGSYLLNENDSCLNIYSKSVWVGKIDEGAD